MVGSAEAGTCRLRRRGYSARGTFDVLRRMTPSKMESVPQDLVRGRGEDSSYSFLKNCVCRFCYLRKKWRPEGREFAEAGRPTGG